MKTLRDIIRAFIGFILVFAYHIPRLIYLSLLVSYAAVFNNRPTLTANPSEHIERARRILKRGRLSELLYAALELRFALERMAQKDLILASMASNRMLDEYNPVKKLSHLHRLNPNSAHEHEIYMVNKKTGERFKWGNYKPLNKSRVSSIQGRLGDLLHPKDGLSLGMPDDPWYLNTRKFLIESLDYLQTVYKDNTSFFAFEGLEHIEMVKVSGEDN